MIRRSLLRVTTAGGLICAALALRRATTPALAAVRAGAAGFDELLGLAAALVCWALVGWVALVLAVTALGALPGAVGGLAFEASAWLTPVAWGRAARLVLGLAVAAGPAAVGSVANAAPAATTVASTVNSSGTDALYLPAVGRPGWSESTSPRRVEAETTRPEQAVTVAVRQGDCLWTIAASSLGPGASDAEIAAEWPRWYRANRRIIGADPNLILPGTVLTAPPAR